MKVPSLAVQWLGLHLLMQGVQARCLAGELKSLKPKHKNGSNIVTNSMKILKMVHIKKKKILKHKVIKVLAKAEAIGMARNPLHPFSFDTQTFVYEIKA